MTLCELISQSSAKEDCEMFEAGRQQAGMQAAQASRDLAAAAGKQGGSTTASTQRASADQQQLALATSPADLLPLLAAAAAAGGAGAEQSVAPASVDGARQEAEPGQLPFAPCCTPSIAAALSASLPAGRAVRGARTPASSKAGGQQAGSWQTWVRGWCLRHRAAAMFEVGNNWSTGRRGGSEPRRHVAIASCQPAVPLQPPSCPQIHYSGKQAFLGRLARQPAAVAADLVVVWQRYCLSPKVAQKVGQRGGRTGISRAHSSRNDKIGAVACMCAAQPSVAPFASRLLPVPSTCLRLATSGMSSCYVNSGGQLAALDARHPWPPTLSPSKP